MANLTSKLIISLVDRVSGPARAMQGALNGLVGVGGRRGGLGGAAGTAALLGSQMRGLKNNAAGATALSAGLAMVGRSGFEAAYGLEKALNKMQAFGQLTADQRQLMSQYAQDLNKDYPFTNKEIVEAASELFRAGFSYEQARGALRSTLDMALAGDIDRGEAADIATNVLTAMRMPMATAEQAAQSALVASDTLAYAATKSNTDIRLLGQTFKYVAPLAAAAGMSIYEVAAASMTMANNGIKGSEAGVAMRSALVRMAKPTKDMMATLERLHINLGEYIKGGRAVGTDDILTGLMASGIDASSERKAIDAMLADKVLALKPAQLVANLTDLIAKDVGGAADKNVIAEALQDTLTASGQNYDLLGFTEALRNKGVGIGEISRIMDIRQGARILTMLLGDLKADAANVATQSEGAARRMADTMQQGIVGQVARLAAAWENLFVTLGKAGVLDTIGTAFDKMAGALTSLSQSNPALLEFGTYGLMTVAVVGPLGILLGGLVAAFSMLGGVLKVAGLGMALLGIRMAKLLSIGKAAAGVASMAGLFAGGAAAVKATQAGAKVAAGMGAAGKAAEASAHGSKMIAGMSAAGAGAALTGKGAGAMGKLARLGGKGLTRLFWPLGLGLAAWDAWEGYQKTGTLTGAALNAATFGLYSGQAQAAPASGFPGAGAALASGTAGAASAVGGGGSSIESTAQVITSSVQSQMAQMQGIISAIDLRAEGRRIMESLAAGLQDGGGAVAAAAQAAGAAQIRNAVRGAYSDGAR